MDSLTNEICRLCGHSTIPFYQMEFHECLHCGGISRILSSLPFPEKEKKRYDQHQNSPDDGYTDFIFPLVNYIQQHISKEKKGLDFGCGAETRMSHLLEKSGFKIENYDPFYQNHPELLKQKYDFIIACEVVEHFHFPSQEFWKLKEIITENGELLIMTHLYDASIPFEKWYYKNDFTHVFFYTPKTIEWIKNHYEFTEMVIEGRFIRLKN